MTAKKIILALALTLREIGPSASLPPRWRSSADRRAHREERPRRLSRLGYPAGSGYGAGLYADAPGYVAGHDVHARRGRVDVAR